MLLGLTDGLGLNVGLSEAFQATQLLVGVNLDTVSDVRDLAALVEVNVLGDIELLLFAGAALTLLDSVGGFAFAFQSDLKVEVSRCKQCKIFTSGMEKTVGRRSFSSWDCGGWLLSIFKPWTSLRFKFNWSKFKAARLMF